MPAHENLSICNRRGEPHAALLGVRCAISRLLCAGFLASMRMRQHADQANAAARL
jgi:hypothetical protein